MRVVLCLFMVLLLTGCATVEERFSSPATSFTLEEAQGMAEEFIRQSATYRFDGDRLLFSDARGTHNSYILFYTFTSSHAGYGDRTGQDLSLTSVQHEVKITVTREGVQEAFIDDDYDMLAGSLTRDNVVVCPQDAFECEDGSFVKRDPNNGCEFRPCPEDVGYEAIKYYCRDNQRTVEGCAELYEPVCGFGSFGSEEFSNSCFACQDVRVEYWTEDVCSS